MNRKVILDCDTGEDDALAILLAIKNHLPLTHIFASYGNTSLENATKNSSELLSLINARSIKVVKGSSKPLRQHPIEGAAFSAGDFVGKNGLCNTELPPSTIKNIIDTQEKGFEKQAVEILIQIGPVDYIVTGPATNLARLCRFLGPETKTYISHIFMMGGSLYIPGNSGPLNPATKKPFAEFNFYSDAQAVDIVLKSGVPLSLVSWDLTSTVTLPYQRIQRFASRSAVGDFAINLMKNFFSYYGLDHDRDFELNDPLTVFAYLGHGSFKAKKINIVTRGIQYGRSIAGTGFPVQYFILSEREKDTLIRKILSDLDITL